MIRMVRFEGQPRKKDEGKAPTFTCTLLAHLRKCLILNGAGEGNRTLVIITKAVLFEKPMFQGR